MSRPLHCVALVAVTVLAACAGEPPPVEPHPGARWGHLFVHDPVRDEIVLYGGATAPKSFLGDTWVLRGDRWEERTVEGPPARGFAAAAFDPARGAVVLHGGRALDGSTHSDTWAWDGDAWRKLEESSGFVADHHRMAYFPPAGALVAFGGWNGEEVLGETWIWEEGWRRLDVEGPPPRSAFGMAYEPSRRRLVLHGGNWINGQYADVWSWDGSAWTALSGPYDNSSIDHLELLHDPLRSRLLVFGGKNYRYQPLGRVSVVRDGVVRSLGQSEGPRPRHSVGLTWDAPRRRMVLYGGKYYRLETAVALDDLWVWSDGEWTPIGPDSDAGAS